MGLYGISNTWKIVYVPKVLNGGMRGVALVEGANRQQAMYNFSKQYVGQYNTVESCTKM